MHTFWADKHADKAREHYRKTKRVGPIVISDWKTPSGRIHVGALRGVVLHDAVARSLRFSKSDVQYIYGFDDFDPFDKVPSYLNYETYSRYLGYPLVDVPAPTDGGLPGSSPTAQNNYAVYYSREFEEIYRKLGVDSVTYRSSSLYKEGWLNRAILIALREAKKIRESYQNSTKHFSKGRSVKASVDNDWFPLNIICNKCHRISTTYITDWKLDGEKAFVSYECRMGDNKVVSYVEGCGYIEKDISPYDGAAKLAWKVEWPAKWFILQTDLEGGGKDHYTKGGSREVANEIYKNVFVPEIKNELKNKEYPDKIEDLFYEWLYFGGKKMSTSKGVGVAAKEAYDFIPPELLRFLIVRTKPTTWVNFELSDEAVSSLFDEYDKVLREAVKDPLGSSAAVMKAALIKNRELPEYVERFRTIVSLLQAELLRPRPTETVFQDLAIKVTERILKKANRPLTLAEEEELDRRIDYLKSRQIGDVKRKIEYATIIPELTKEQISFLVILKQEFVSLPVWTSEYIKEAIRRASQNSDIEPKVAFNSIYKLFLGQDSGPNVASYLAEYGKEATLLQLQKASNA